MQGVMPRDTGFEQALCANMNGFSLHAAVRCGANERNSLEQLCRYITRPALANERVQCNAAGQVVLKLKTAWHDGTTHLVMSPLEFMQRLAGSCRARGCTSSAFTACWRPTRSFGPRWCRRGRSSPPTQRNPLRASRAAPVAGRCA